MDGDKSDLQELNEAAVKSNEILFTATSVFPFMLFPDTITIDKSKVTIKRRKFFNVEEVISMHIEDVLNVEADTGPFFGSLKVWTRFFSGEPLKIEYLKRDDTDILKNIIQGLIVARQEDIDITNIPLKECIPKLQQLGKAPEGEEQLR